MSLPTRYVISDVRTLGYFKEKSFSGYSTKDVVSTLKKNILNILSFLCGNPFLVADFDPKIRENNKSAQ